MKKKLAILAAMMMAATMFASCGDSSSSSTANETTTAPAESAADTTSSEAETTTAPEESKPEETTAEVTEAAKVTLPAPVELPENAYGIAGISFQVRDSWEHRNAVGELLLNESSNKSFAATCNDVYITGNGDYEVSLEGWWCEFDEALLGWVGLDTTIPVEVKDNVATFKDYPDAKITLTEYQQDGKTFDLSGSTVGMEDNGTDNHGGTIKVVNSWAGEQIDQRGIDEYKCLTWQSTDPVVIKFTVSGLPTDKAADEDVTIKFESPAGELEAAE